MVLLAYMQKRCYFCSQNESGADGKGYHCFYGVLFLRKRKTQGRKRAADSIRLK